MTTIVVPFRDRTRHLQRFVPHMETLLNRLRVPFELLIIEQSNNHPFNRGKLMNIGFLLRSAQSQSVVTHDIDMLPQRSGCGTCGAELAKFPDYKPEHGITHMAGRASQFKDKLPYSTYVGGVIKFDIDSFVKINGYSNEFWGWGAEDDDLYNRIVHSGIKLKRQDYKYLSLYHRRFWDDTLYKRNKSLLTKLTESGLTDCEFSIKSEKKFQSARIISVDFDYI